MTTKTFIEKFDLFIDAPNGCHSLREIVLQLAVRGKLTNRAKDESCGVQLKLIDAFRTKRGRKGNAGDDDTPFPLPGNWGWVALGDSMEMVNGRAFKPEEWSSEGTPIIRIQNLNNENAPFNRCKAKLDAKTHVHDGDFLISWSGTPGTSFGAFIWNRGFAYLNQHIFRCELVNGVFIKEFLRLAINARLDEMISQAHGAVGLRHITKGKLESIRLPLPPLAEQKRIVAKVDELMALCDRLESQQKEREEKHVVLARASLARFAENPTPANLEFLFHKSYIIDPADLRKSILTLAVQGKLVPPNPNDEPVSILLSRVLEERRRLNQTEHVRVSDIVTLDGLAYEIPASWRWQSLNDLLIFGPTNGISPKAVEHETPVRSLTLTATTTGRFKGEHSKFIATQVPADDDLWLRDGDILVQRGNTAEYVGVAAIYRGESNRYVYPDLMMKLRVSTALDPAFVHIAMSEERARNFLRMRASGTTGTMPKINQATLKNLPLPVPPLAEQHRIVTKVDQLMALVDQLEAHLTASSATAEKLMEAVIVEIIRPAPAEKIDVAPDIRVELKSEPNEIRIANAGRFACYILHRWRDLGDMGRTKLEKANHLAEYHCGIELNRHPIRYKRGPVDYELLRAAEQWAGENDGFYTNDLGNDQRVIYTPGPALEIRAAEAEAIIGNQKSELNRVLSLLAPINTHDCGVLATIYTAWNDLLLEAKTPNNRDIIRDARHHWHETKTTIEDKKWFWAIRWLEAKNLTPQGKGRPVRCSN